MKHDESAKCDIVPTYFLFESTCQEAELIETVNRVCSEIFART